MTRPAQQSFPFGAPTALRSREAIGERAWLLRGFVADEATSLIAAVRRVENKAPFRRMVTPSGLTMSVAMTGCGDVVWVTDRKGYRYSPVDPTTGRPWPGMPKVFRDLATRAAAEAGFEGFTPDACLINRYEIGTRLSLHQDRDERDFTAPIVSVSLGLPAVFLFGGPRRSDRPQRIRVENGDVVIWGGPSRLVFHGVAPLAAAEHPLTGPFRINLTFRKAL